MMATLLPNAKTQFLDQNGKPLVAGQVFFYIPNTSTKKDTYQDPAQTILNTNPVVLDMYGQAIIWGTGTFRQVVYDQFGNLIWDQITQDANSGLTGNLTDKTYVAGVDFTPGVTTQLTLPSDPGSVSNTWIFFDSAYQADSNVSSINYPTLTFSAPIPVGVQTVTIKIGNTVAIGVPGAGSITDASVSPNSKLYVRINDSIDVKDPAFGAKGDGVADDTAAIQAAINYAQSLFKTDYWSTYVPSVRIPAGIYNVSGLNISYPIHLFGDGQNATELNLINGSNKNVIAIADMSGVLTGNDPSNIQPIISDMSIGGNSSGQTPGSQIRCISLTDSAVPVSTAYHGGAELRNLNLRAATQFAVYIGTNRNNGRMSNVRTLYSNNEGCYNNSYDWRIVDCDFGNSQTANGFTQNTGGATEMVNCNIFDNFLSGLFLNTGVNASCLFVNCYFDTNKQHGVVGIGSYGDIVSHAFSNCVWRDNSQQADNSYDHINLSNMTQVTIEGATFVVNISATQPRYLVNTSNVNRVVFNATYEENDTPNIPYHTAITNNFLNLAIGGNENCSLSTMGASTVGIVGLNGARFDTYDAASISGQRRWRWQAAGSIYSLLTTDDVGSTTSLVAQVTRTGNTPNAIQTVSVQPYSDNIFPSGAASFRWSVVYAGTGTINTSDENSKDQIEPIPDAWLDAWETVEYTRYKMRDSLAEKGDTARWHIGLIAQRVRDAFAAKGIDAHAIGLLCYDEWEASPATIDEHTGKELIPARPAGSRYGLRYEEAMCLEAALMRREINKLKKAQP